MLELKKNKIILKNTKELGVRVQQSFELDISDIEIVSMTGKYILDDEELYITFIDLNGELFHVNTYCIKFEATFLKMLESKLDYKYDSTILTPEHYEQGRSVIVYPKSLMRKDLYKPNTENLKTFWYYLLRVFMVKPFADGVLTNEVELYLKERRALK